MNGMDRDLTRVREYVAAALAVIVIIGAASMFGVALVLTDDKDQFSHAIELIKIGIPLVSFVLGYYFSKSSTERRAESAEESLKDVTRISEMAIEERKSAVIENDLIRSNAKKTKEALRELFDSSKALVPGNSLERDDLLGHDEGYINENNSKKHLKLQEALKKAEGLLTNSE